MPRCGPLERERRGERRPERLRLQQRRLTAAFPGAQGLASQLFAASLFPYLAFLYNLRRAKGPPLTFFGFSFLLVFVFATIPAGIYGALLAPQEQ